MRKLRFVGVRLVLFGIAAITVAGFGVSFLWNQLMPAIFGLPVIGFWQALGLMLLSRVLLGSWSGGMRKPRFVRGWNSLTPEERERFRRGMGGHCHPGFPPEQSQEKA